jgi:glutamate-1-semialdehyde 2,1-aminomutase
VAGVSTWHIKTLWMQEMLARGVLSVGTHNISFAHSEGDIAHLLQAYDAVLPLIRVAVAEKNVRDYLRCVPLEPLFRVR